MKINDNNGVKGRFRFTTKNKITGEVKVGDWIHNKIVSSSNHGLNLFCQHLIGTTTFPLEITQAKIGTGTTAPALSDTDLETPVLSGILRADQLVTNNVVELEFFIADTELANGTYTEFGLFCGNQLFARAIIDPSFTKSSNEDASVEYILEFTSL